MATVFQARPRSIDTPPRAFETCSVSHALAALDAAARQVVEATSSSPEERRHAAELLAGHARRIAQMDREANEAYQ